MMIDMASSISYVEFDDVKDCTTTKKMWDKFAKIHGGDKNVLRAKEKSLSGKFDDMRIKGEIVARNCGQIKEEVNAIRGVGADISKETMIGKVLIILLPIYEIRVSTIQELRCTLGNDLTLDSLIGRLTAFELSKFDNYTPSSVECDFKSKLTLDGSKRKKSSKRRPVDSNIESDDDLDDLGVLLARRILRGKKIQR